MIPRTRRPSSPRGFSLVELLVALAITLLVTSAVFAMLDPASGAFQTQPEAADVLQRVRAGTDALRRDLIGAGSGPAVAAPTPSAGPIAAAVFPMRVGRRNPDAAGTFDATRVTYWSVSPSAPQARLALPLASSSGTVTIAAGPGCPDGDVTCGFRAGTTAVVIAPAGAWDLFSVTAVQGSVLTLQHNLRDSPRVSPATDSTIAEATTRAYFFREDRGTGATQLMRYDAAGGADVPVLDHIVNLQFAYSGEAEPPRMVATLPGEPLRTTYGPLPPQASVALPAFPAGENCVFTRSAAGVIVSRLPALASTPALVPLTPADLTDGPWCPDESSPNRYDADLLRLREIVVTLRVESALASLRGPAGPLFSRGGTARGTRFVPDRQVRLVVAPRALNGGR